VRMAAGLAGLVEGVPAAAVRTSEKIGNRNTANCVPITTERLGR
jgi:hypothetical protein